VAEQLAQQLTELWNRLPVERSSPAEPAGLGYRSCSLSGPDGRRWTAYRGVVRLAAAGRTEFRRDDDGAFERELLASAPDGLLPSGSDG